VPADEGPAAAAAALLHLHLLACLCWLNLIGRREKIKKKATYTYPGVKFKNI